MAPLLTREAVIGSRTQAASLVGVGIGVWLLATVGLRVAGQFLLPPDDPGRVAFVFVATVPLMAMVAFAVYSLLDVAPERRLTAATLLVLPGMVLDAVVVSAFGTVFPDMATATGSTLGGLLLLAYASVLLTGIVPLSYVSEESGESADRPSERTTDGSAEHAGGNGVGED
ncbi:DUF5367 family protein [Salinigranum marinum]|uniref:DUF5367 family protein n=1 Tax=Salinigranum marinum TaxID=1515595 RepID=UPI002989C44F|nr:DUF5367 family protein [Salinigranum marinum]